LRQGHFALLAKGPIDAWEPYLEPADAIGADDANAASMDFTIFFSNTLNQIARCVYRKLKLGGW
jgi:hypothetical protein